MTPQRAKMLNALIAVLGVLFLWLFIRRCQPITATRQGFSIPPSNFVGGDLLLNVTGPTYGPTDLQISNPPDDYSFNFGDMIFGGNTFDGSCPTCCNQSSRYVPTADAIARALGYA